MSTTTEPASVLATLASLKQRRADLAAEARDLEHEIHAVESAADLAASEALAAGRDAPADDDATERKLSAGRRRLRAIAGAVARLDAEVKDPAHTVAAIKEAALLQATAEAAVQREVTRLYGIVKKAAPTVGADELREAVNALFYLPADGREALAGIRAIVDATGAGALPSMWLDMAMHRSLNSIK
jgi:uncharacterized protein YlxW (UPF0749 family)